MQAISSKSSVFVAPRFTKAASTSKVSACAPRRAAQPVRCMAFDAKKAGTAVASTAVSFSLLMGPAMAEYSISDEFKGLMDTPAKAAPVAAARAAAPVAAPVAAANPVAALADEGAIAAGAALKAELAAQLGIQAEAKATKNFAASSPKAPKVAGEKAVKAPKEAAVKAPKAAKEGGDPTFLIAMVVLFSPFALATGVAVFNLIGALGRAV